MDDREKGNGAGHFILHKLFGVGWAKRQLGVRAFVSLSLSLSLIQQSASQPASHTHIHTLHHTRTLYCPPLLCPLIFILLGSPLVVYKDPSHVQLRIRHQLPFTTRMDLDKFPSYRRVSLPVSGEPHFVPRRHCQRGVWIQVGWDALSIITRCLTLFKNRISNKTPVMAKVSSSSFQLEREFYVMRKLYNLPDGGSYIGK